MSALSLWPARSRWLAWDPFDQFDAVVRQAFGAMPTWPVVDRTDFVPSAEVRREGDDAVVRLELPGLDPDKDITVEVEGHNLVVRGERRDEWTDEEDGRVLREMRYGAFRRSFRLPTHVTSDAVTASYDAGVLTVRVAGAYAAAGDATRIPITSGV